MPKKSVITTISTYEGEMNIKNFTIKLSEPHTPDKLQRARQLFDTHLIKKGLFPKGHGHLC